jgi:hypothetical protein
MSFSNNVYLVTVPALGQPDRIFGSALKAAVFIARHERSIPHWQVFVGTRDDAGGLVNVSRKMRPMVRHVQKHLPTRGDFELSADYNVNDDEALKRFKSLRIDRCRKETPT